MSGNQIQLLDVRAITFDVDGTLYDLRRQKLKLAPHLLRHPLILSRYNQVVESLRHERHPNMRAEICRRLGEQVGTTPMRVKQVVDGVIHGSWPASFSKRTPWRGLIGLLDRIDRAGIPRAVVSDYASEIKLDRMGLTQGWAEIVDCERLGALKPHPDGLLAAAQTMGVDPKHVLHIGDRAELDGEMARSAGAHCLILGRDYKNIRELTQRLF